ncbi:WhiB family transcriptional regulator, partial [Streptomyces sp. A30]|uniref:WhiB family transcriptional regulator n=1 Tax=Streptomyces sp. A30 TaxID=2789273 RepID=UPI00397E9358
MGPHPSRRRCSVDWRDMASCRDGDPDLFFPIGNSSSAPSLIQVDRAKAVCRLLWGLPCGARRVETTLCSSAPVWSTVSCATPVALPDVAGS